MKFNMQFLSPIRHFSSAQKPHAGSGYHIEQHKSRTCPSLQKVLLDSTSLETKLLSLEFQVFFHLAPTNFLAQRLKLRRKK